MRRITIISCLILISTVCPAQNGQRTSSNQWNFGDLYKELKALSAGDLPALRARADSGDARSQFLLGLVYQYGAAGLSQDLNQAFYWHKKAAEQGNALPENWVGQLYYRGYGTPPDFAEAAKWFRRATENGDSVAPSLLSFLLISGQGIARDYAESKRLLQLAADRHNQEARAMLVELGPTCTRNSCIDVQTLMVLRKNEFYAIRGAKLSEVNKPADDDNPFPIQITRWEGKLPIAGAKDCELSAEKEDIGGNKSLTTYFYRCMLLKNANKNEAYSKFDEMAMEIRAAFPANATLIYCGAEGCRPTPTSNRFTFDGGFSIREMIVRLSNSLVSKYGEPDRFDLALTFTNKSF